MNECVLSWWIGLLKFMTNSNLLKKLSTWPSPSLTDTLRYVNTHVHTPLYQVFKRTSIFRSASVNDEFFLCAHCHCLWIIWCVRCLCTNLRVFRAQTVLIVVRHSKTFSSSVARQLSLTGSFCPFLGKSDRQIIVSYKNYWRYDPSLKLQQFYFRLATKRKKRTCN